MRLKEGSDCPPERLKPILSVVDEALTPRVPRAGALDRRALPLPAGAHAAPVFAGGDAPWHRARADAQRRLSYPRGGDPRPRQGAGGGVRLSVRKGQRAARSARGPLRPQRGERPSSNGVRRAYKRSGSGARRTPPSGRGRARRTRSRPPSSGRWRPSRALHRRCSCCTASRAAARRRCTSPSSPALWRRGVPPSSSCPKFPSPRRCSASCASGSAPAPPSCTAGFRRGKSSTSGGGCARERRASPSARAAPCSPRSKTSASSF